jgi:gamma-glutamyl-gamma-aminobutyrate hydrolase PuuD
VTSAARFVALSQRVEVVPGRSERRDALDQGWHRFLAQCGLTAVPVPNSPETSTRILETLNPVGVILTGGIDQTAYGGDAPERDATEKVMLEWAMANDRPLLGVCRGLQFIAHNSGATLKPASGHVATRHQLIWDGDRVDVNSYHNWGFDEPPRGFEATARCEDGTVEAIRHKSKPIAGIMWHPEREAAAAPHDLNLFRRMFSAPS